MAKTVIMEGDGHNNKREHCMIRKEDTIYFDELTELLLLPLSFLLLIIIDSVSVFSYSCCRIVAVAVAVAVMVIVKSCSSFFPVSSSLSSYSPLQHCRFIFLLSFMHSMRFFILNY